MRKRRGKKQPVSLNFALIIEKSHGVKANSGLKKKNHKGPAMLPNLGLKLTNHKGKASSFIKFMPKIKKIIRSK